MYLIALALYLTITCYCIVPHELLQFCRDKLHEPNGSCENINDEFSDITGLLKFYQKDTVPENSLLPYESNKKWT